MTRQRIAHEEIDYAQQHTDPQEATVELHVHRWQHADDVRHVAGWSKLALRQSENKDAVLSQPPGPVQPDVQRTTTIHTQ